MRPEARPFTRLPVLEKRRGELETCTFCPKLCRSACPVSNAEPRETLTPWGKMFSTHALASAGLPAGQTQALPAWACTGCLACRESCDHRNDVAGTLLAARAAHEESNLSPPEATRVIHRFSEIERETGQGLKRLAPRAPMASGARHALLVGCLYTRRLPTVAKDILDFVDSFLGGDVAFVDRCCGLPLLLAGSGRAFRAHAETFARSVRGANGLVVADPGCATTLRDEYPRHSLTLPPVRLFVEEVAERLEALPPMPSKGRVRWHDPCHLGRGLGLWAAPRAILSRILGHEPEEFVLHGARAACSGAGGLVPVTFPTIARVMTKTRVEDHKGSGGGVVVTGCASSVLAFRKAGVEVVDIATAVARAARKAGW